MPAVKTAVSMDEELFRQVEETAQEMKVSRSRVVVLALRDYLKRRERRRITEQLNAVYGEDYELDEEDKGFIRRGKRTIRRIAEEEGDRW